MHQQRVHKRGRLHLPYTEKQYTHITAAFITVMLFCTGHIRQLSTALGSSSKMIKCLSLYFSLSLYKQTDEQTDKQTLRTTHLDCHTKDHAIAYSLFSESSSPPPLLTLIRRLL